MEPGTGRGGTDGLRRGGEVIWIFVAGFVVGVVVAFIVIALALSNGNGIKLPW